MPSLYDYLKLFAELIGATKKPVASVSEKKIMKELRKNNKDMKKTLSRQFIINIIIAFAFTLLGYFLGFIFPINR